VPKLAISAINEEIVLHVARTARINLTPEEIRTFPAQLQEILAAFSKLSEIDTSDTKPSFHPIPLSNHTRDDEIKPSISNEDALRNTQHRKDNYFKGPSAI
jgi:aspartyl-tRNA(Asn)/glutamyl-tRNA(Gln) amidotransferase subunit C